MLRVISKIIQMPVLGNIVNRLGNKYTAQGSLLLLYVMAEQGIISSNTVKALEGVNNLHIWILVGFAFYLIIKAPEFFLENKFNKLKHDLAIKKLNLEKKKIDLEILKLKKY